MRDKATTFGLLVSMLGIFFFTQCNTNYDNNLIKSYHEPAIDPDYSGVTIPPNIAPLNFLIKENRIHQCIEEAKKTDFLSQAMRFFE